MNVSSNYETHCDPATGICTAKLRVSRRSAYEIPEARQGAWVREQVKNSPSHEYLGYGLHIVKRDVDLAARRATFIASTPQIDRYGDVILQDGWQTENYKANPVILFAHDSRALPVGKGILVNVNGNLAVTVEFSKAIASYDLPEILLQLVAQGMLNCVSVGFIPIEYEWRFEKDEEGNQLPFPSGRIYKKSELLEISIVPVPANPGAVVISNAFENAFRAVEDTSEEVIAASSVERAYFVHDSIDGVVYEHGSRNPTDHEGAGRFRAFPALLVKMYKDGQSRPFVLKDRETANVEAVRAMERDSFASQGFFCELDGYDDNGLPVYRSVSLLAREQFSESQNSFKEHEETTMPNGCNCNGTPNAEQKSVVPFHHYPLAPSAAPWDAAKEMGSTDKPEDWKKMSAIVLNDGKNKGDYKLPHHKGPDGKFATVRRGVAAALARTNQVKGASDAEKKGARAHLVKHMAEFHKESGKAFDEEAFLRDLEAMEAMRDSYAEGSAEQEAVARAIAEFAEENEKAFDVPALARTFATIGAEGKAIIVQEILKRFPVEARKFSDETVNKKMQKAHKSMSSAQDELHGTHEDAMDMLGQACGILEKMFKPAADGSKSADEPGQETVAAKVGKVYEMAYEAKQMVRRAASRYNDHMGDAVDRLEAMCAYFEKDAADGDGPNDTLDPDSANNSDNDADGDQVENFYKELATKLQSPASNGSTGTEPAQSALTAGLAQAEEDLAAALLKATTADDHAAH